MPNDKKIPSHKFTPAFSPRRPMHAHPNEPNFECALCEREYARGEGARSLVAGVFSVREIAETLIGLGEGHRYRRTAAKTRRTIERVGRSGSTSDEANLATDYIDAFAPLIDEALGPKSWPWAVVLDSLPFRFQKSAAQIAEERAVKKDIAWPNVIPALQSIAAAYENQTRGTAAVFAAVGYQTTGRIGKPWHAKMAASMDQDSWDEFLLSLDGEPTFVIADRDGAIAPSVGRVWPNATFFACEWHLKSNAEALLLADEIIDPLYMDVDPLYLALRAGLNNEKHWQELIAQAKSRDAVSLLAWIGANDELVHRQMELRTKVPVTSNGAVENFFATTVRPAFFRRSHLFRNRRRLDKLLALMRAQAAGEADLQVYSRLIREHLAATGGLANIAWSSHRDAGGADSIAIALEQAIRRHQVLQHQRQLERNRQKLAQQRAADLARRAALGLVKVKRERPPKRASVAGMFVADLPELMAEWNTEMNIGVDPKKVPAGTGRYVWWRCPEVAEHEWRSQVRSRSISRTRCPFCTGRLTIRSVSIEMTHPEIAAEWHPTKNGKLLLSEVSYGSGREVWWVCPTGLKTHDYTCRVAARTSQGVGCAKCARKRGTGGAPKKRGRRSKRGARPRPGK